MKSLPEEDDDVKSIITATIRPFDKDDVESVMSKLTVKEDLSTTLAMLRIEGKPGLESQWKLGPTSVINYFTSNHVNYKQLCNFLINYQEKPSIAVILEPPNPKRRRKSRAKKINKNFAAESPDSGSSDADEFQRRRIPTPRCRPGRN